MQDSAAKVSVDGESDASIVSQHMRRVQHLARQHSDGSNTDDLVQEGLIALLAARQTWRAEAQFFTYARSFVVSAMVRYATSQVSEPSRPTGNRSEMDNLSVVASAEKPADYVLELAELSALLADGMFYLTSEERRVTKLHFFQGISLHEIAREHGVSSKDTACRIVQSAIAKLRERVQARL